MTGPDRPGARKLRHALRRFRRRRKAADLPRPPLDLRPTTPFEQEILHQYQELRRDFEDLKKKVDWLTIAIVGAALTMILERIFAAPGP